MSDLEPGHSPQLNLDPNAAPKLPPPEPGKKRGPKFVAALVTVGALLGGAVAATQLYDYFFRPDKPPIVVGDQPAETGLPSGWSWTQPPGGPKFGLPNDWQVIDQSTFEATLRMMGLEPMTPMANKAIYVKPKRDPDETGTVLGVFCQPSLPINDPPSKIAEDAMASRQYGPRQSGRFVQFVESADVVPTKSGDAARLILSASEAEDPNARITMITYSFMWSGQNGWILMFFTGAGDELDHAPTFLSIAESTQIEGMSKSD